MRFCNVHNCSQPVFRTDKNTKEGYCSSHWRQYSTDIDSRSIVQKAMDKHKLQDKNVRIKRAVRSLPHISDSEMEQYKILKAELDLWFMVKMRESPKRCQNCGKDLSNLNNIDWKGSQHHILEKSVFKSVRTHPDNHLVLGRWCCHPQWHTSMLNASKMPIFPEANRKVVEILLPLLKNEEKRRISEYYAIPL